MPRPYLAAFPLLLSMLLGRPLRADPLFPADSFAGLHAQMARHERQFWAFNARPFGISLDANLASAAARDSVALFLAQTASDDVESITGAHPYDLISGYGEFGDLGMFGGVAVAAVAYRYRVLRREGAPAEVLAKLRARVVRAAKAWHICHEITGVPGVVVRGLRRLVPEEPDAPPLPGSVPQGVPLFDDAGQPLPAPKDNGTWRADNSGGSLPAGVWMWADSASKDQLVGHVFGAVALYDALRDNPEVDQSLVKQMAEDARQTAVVLMEMRDITKLEGPAGKGLYDLIIMDADGRPTFHHDLNPYSLEKFYLQPGNASFNTFNLIMALGVLKGLHHMSGDPAVESYLYGELLGARDYLGMLVKAADGKTLDYTYAGTRTNFSNVNMITTALWLAIHLETDEGLLDVYHRYLERRWWDRPGQNRSARYAKQPFFHVVYMGLTAEGVAPALVQETADLLGVFDLGPYLNPLRENCDAGEVAAGVCLAVDGETTIELDPNPNRFDRPVATEALDPSIRPPSNFDARSDPFNVNGGGGLRLNSGGDLLAAYWMARWLEATGPGQTQASPFARAHIPIPGSGPAPDPAPEATADSGGAADAGPVRGAELPGDSGTPADVSDAGSVMLDSGTGADVAIPPEKTGISAGGGGGCRVVGGSNLPPTLMISWLALAALALFRRPAFCANPCGKRVRGWGSGRHGDREFWWGERG